MQKDLFEGVQKLHPKQREVIVKAASLLAGLNCKYYIKTPDGEVFALGIKAGSGEQVSPAKPAKKFSHGERTAYVKPFIEQAKQPGAMVSIPLGVGMNLKELSQISNTVAHAVLGKGNYQTERDEANNCITILNNGGIRV